MAFEGLKYPVHKATKPLTEEFPELFRIREFNILKKREDYEKVIKYIIFMYDKETDLIHEHEELFDRKEAAAREAGFVKDEMKLWPLQVQEIMNFEDKDVYRAIFAYLRQQNNPLWMEIQVTEQELYEFQALRLEPIKEKDEDEALERAKKKAPLMQMCNDRLEKLEGLYKKFYGDNLDVNEFREMITPEKMERMMDQIQLPLEEDVHSDQ